MMNKILQPFVSGTQLLLSETKWAFIKAIRSWEIRQIKKRLTQEYQTLGQSYADAHLQKAPFDPCNNENDLTLRQIIFLRDEITHLKGELVASRAEFVDKRVSQE